MKNMFKPPAPIVQAAPTPAPPPVMPDPQSPDVLAARRRTFVSANQGGRSSTILSTASTRRTLAGSVNTAAPYSANTLSGGA